MKVKLCAKCGYQGPETDFSNGRNRCYPCRREEENSYNSKNKEKVNKRNREYRARRIPDIIKLQRDLHVKYMRETYRERAIVLQAKKRAKNLGLPFNLVPENIYIPEICPLLGTKIVSNGKMNNRDSSPSLDRLVPSKGYVVGNVRVVCYRANRIKNDATPEELKLIARNIDGYLSNPYSLKTKKAS